MSKAGFWIVVDEEALPRHRLSVHRTAALARAWIGNQPDTAKVERGGYGIDGPCTSVDLVTPPPPVPGDPGVHCVLVEGSNADDCATHAHEFVGVAVPPHNPDLNYATPVGDGIFDFVCKTCRCLGSIKVINDDINWDDDEKGCRP